MHDGVSLSPRGSPQSPVLSHRDGDIPHTKGLSQAPFSDVFASKRVSPELELRIEAFTTLTPVICWRTCSCSCANVGPGCPRCVVPEVGLHLSVWLFHEGPTPRSTLWSPSRSLVKSLHSFRVLQWPDTYRRYPGRSLAHLVAVVVSLSVLHERCCRISGSRTGGDARHRCFWS